MARKQGSHQYDDTFRAQAMALVIDQIMPVSAAASRSASLMRRSRSGFMSPAVRQSIDGFICSTTERGCTRH